MNEEHQDLSPLAQEKLSILRAFYNAPERRPGSGSDGYKRLLAQHYNRMIPPEASVLEVGCGRGDLLAMIRARRRVGVDLSARCVEKARRAHPECEFHVGSGELLDLEERFDVILLSGTVNHAADVQVLLRRLLRVSHPGTRLQANLFNHLWQPFSSLATALRIRENHPPENWFSRADFLRLLALSGWDTVTTVHRILCPLRIPLLQDFLNRWAAPLLPPLCLTVFFSARPKSGDRKPMTVSVIIPARNEAGTIEQAVARTPVMGAGTELILIEGHSRDNTWEEMLRVAANHPEKNISLLRQRGEGKGDAVREGFSAASGEIVMILDADLTVQPEELPKFYEAIASGYCEFANGVRLSYPLENESMRFLNLCANKAFGLAFSWLLGQNVKDTLCGTKAMLRADYERIAADRARFGVSDPFGDFDLLFGAAHRDLRIADIPIRYRERTYGSTNIRRWHHGVLLLRMLLTGARRLKFP